RRSGHPAGVATDDDEPLGRATHGCSPLFHHAGLVRACSVAQRKWCLADALNGRAVSTPAANQRRAPFGVSRTSANALARAQSNRMALYAGSCSSDRPSASVSHGTPPRTFHGQIV